MMPPTKDEVAQWKQQTKDMKKAGFAWNKEQNMWQRGELMVEPWAQPWMYPKKKS